MTTTARAILEGLLPHAMEQAEDWESGVRDGTYDSGPGRALPAALVEMHNLIRQAHDLLRQPPVPDAADLLREAVAAVPDDDSPIPGADLVEWFCEWRERAKTAVAAAAVQDFGAAAALAGLKADAAAMPLEGGDYAALRAKVMAAPLPLQASLVIEISGGNVQSVATNAPHLPVRVIVVDYDNGEAEGDRCPLVPGSGGGEPEFASVSDWPPDLAPDGWCQAVAEIADGVAA